ncbi:MAG: nickel pincer cofactor biosynthesis protein LarB [Acidimicrobiales bacterium]
MDERTLQYLLDQVQSGEMEVGQAVEALRRLPFSDLNYAKVDHHRQVRLGHPEAVFAPGKSVEQCLGIVADLLEGSGPVIVTRASADQVAELERRFPGAVVGGSTLVWRPARPRAERVVVVTAGTGDGPVAEECALTLRAYGLCAEEVRDVGVAGLHRMLDHVEALQAADAVVVLAGMEGALASVVAGITAAHVVAVPTSVGYGASLEGITALLGMLASCAPGLVVVGIDNGYGAACAVVRALRGTTGGMAGGRAVGGES